MLRPELLRLERKMTENTPLPENERERLEALINFDILEKMSENELLPLLKMAAFACQTSMAIFSIYEGQRHIIKLKIGLSVYDMQSDNDFCLKVIKSKEFIEVPDTMRDPEFSRHPSVIGHPGFRHFSGVPITTNEGFNIGSICVVDTRPKSLYPEQIETLKRIAEQIRHMLALKKQNKQLQSELNQLIHEKINQTEIDLALYKFALDQSVEVAISDRDGFIRYVNEKYCNTSKYVKEELLGQPYKIINSGYHPQTFFSDMWSKISKGEVWHGEIKNINKQGHFYWVDCSIIPFLDKKGRPYQYITIQQDITEKKNALERLTIETRLITILSENDTIDNAIKKISHQICLHLDWDIGLFWPLDKVKNKLSGPKIYNHKNLPIPELERQSKAMDINKGEGLPGYVWVSKKPKWISNLLNQSSIIARSSIEETRIMSALVFPVLFRNNVIGVMEFFSFKSKKEDYNLMQMIESFGLQIGAYIERKEAEDELIKAKKEAEESVKSKDQFLTNMSHEIRTPMNAILGFTQLILQTKLDDKQQDYANSVKVAAENLLSIINDILDFSKIESGIIEIELSPTNISQTFKNVYDLLGLIAAQKQLKFTYHVDQNIPNALLCDALRLNQILINLVGNAIKFTESGSVKFFAELIEQHGDNYKVRFRVLDTGIGIQSEKQSSIFERFNQVNNEINRKYEGTGLGLSISKNLIELMGGKLGMHSELGVGSEFSFELSLKKILETDKDPQTSKVIASNIPGKLKILLVEDNQLNQKLAKNVLNNFGFEVVIADNGQIGLDILKSRNFDLILMDLQMPELDGYQTTKIIRKELFLSIPIIAMTAHSIVGEKEKCMEAGMNDFISKPFNQKELHDKISRLAEIQFETINIKQATMEEDETINLSYLMELSNGNKSFEYEMISLFRHQVPKEMLTLQRAFDEFEYSRIAETAHKLKSSMDIFNRSDLSLSLQTIIEDARAGNISGETRSRLVSILSELEKFYPKLEHVLKTKYEHVK